MHNVIDYPNASIYGETEHPTEKPLYIINKLVRTHTNEGDLILDCFMGSFTTAVSCHKLQRQFIGFEKDAKFYEPTEIGYEKNIKERLDRLKNRE